MEQCHNFRMSWKTRIEVRQVKVAVSIEIKARLLLRMLAEFLENTFWISLWTLNVVLLFGAGEVKNSKNYEEFNILTLLNSISRHCKS